MATTDIQPRIIDMAGFRIVNLGEPAAPDDATRTDRTSVPLLGAGAGAPGKALLAAPADHQHPEPLSFIALSDPPVLFNSEALREAWFAVVDFDQFAGDTVQFGLAGVLQAQVIELWLDGVLGNPRAGTLVMNISTPSATFVPIADVSSAPIPRPTGPHLLTLTNRPFVPGQPSQSFGRVVTLRGRLRIA